VLGMSDLKPKTRAKVRAKVREQAYGSPAVYGGAAMMATATTWWLIYYAQVQGMFGSLTDKLSCFSGDSYECTNFQNLIGPSAIPVYSPLLLWLGVIVVLLGLFLTRWNKA
jgi:hypothetical protein